MLDQLIIELTNACNSACSFCPRRLSTRKVTHMDMGLFEYLLIQCAAMGFASKRLPIGLCGIGEPLLHPQFDDALALAERHGVPIGVGSNGGALDEHIDAMLDHTPAQVVFSVDAITAPTHEKMRPGVGFDRVVDAVADYLDKLRNSPRQPTDLWVQILVSSINLHEVAPFVREWLPRLQGVKGGKVFVKPICPWPYAAANIMYPSPALTLPDDVRNDDRVTVGQFDAPIRFRDSCILFEHFGQVLSDGSYVPCCMPTSDPWGVGNAADRALSDLFSCDKMQTLRQTPKTELSFCKDCV